MPPAGLASRVAVGVGTIAGAVLLRIPLEDALRGSNTFILLEPAIAIAAWYGGRVSGLVATFVGLLAAIVFYLRGLPDQNETVALALFLSNGILLTMLSAGLRNAYQRATRARERAEESAARSERLQRVSQALNRAMTATQVAETAVEMSMRLLGARAGLLATARTPDGLLRVLASQGFTDGLQPGDEVLSDRSTPLGEAFLSGEPAIFGGREERAARYPHVADQFRLEGDGMALPLWFQGASTGSIYLSFPGTSGYGPGDADFLRSIGAQIGSALERALLNERMQAMSVDELARAAELKTVLEAIGEGVLVSDTRGTVILANPAVGRLIGRVPVNLDELPQRADDDPTPAGSPSRYMVRSPLSRQGWLEISRYPVEAEAASSDVVLVRDVTHLVEADLQRDAFLGVLSHELRTPVTSIMIAVDLLRRRIPAGDRTSELLADIDAESDRLRNIVEDLLVLTRSERGALDVDAEPVLVHRMAGDVAEHVRHDMPEADIVVTAQDDLPAATAEPTYVEQILRNLVSNALKYGRVQDRPIEVAVSLQAGMIETRVMDSGVGLAPGERDRLFTLFYRNPRAIRSAPGAGIGLYVCKLLAEAMGGSIWASPRPGGGAEFGFALPVFQETAVGRRGATGLNRPWTVSGQAAASADTGRYRAAARSRAASQRRGTGATGL